jgi:deoxyribonuclease-1
MVPKRGLADDACYDWTREHVYAASWIASALRCPNRDNCPNDFYRTASSDLHNLLPALRRYNSSRGNQKFGEIPGETQRFPEDNCDFERTSRAAAIVEPRDDVKGDIARSFMYMVDRYNLPTYGMLPLMVRWHLQDPPDEEERRRNERIRELQGNGNPFVD